MTLQEQIKADMKTAMRNKETEKRDFLRVVIAEFSREKDKDLTDDSVLAILKKMKKDAGKVGSEQSEKEIKILENYLPELMSEEAINTALDTIIDETGIEINMKSMGRLMGEFNKKFKGKADNKIVSTLVKQKLQ